MARSHLRYLLQPPLPLWPIVPPPSLAAAPAPLPAAPRPAGERWCASAGQRAGRRCPCMPQPLVPRPASCVPPPAVPPGIARAPAAAQARAGSRLLAPAPWLLPPGSGVPAVDAGFVGVVQLLPAFCRCGGAQLEREQLSRQAIGGSVCCSSGEAADKGSEDGGGRCRTPHAWRGRRRRAGSGAFASPPERAWNSKRRRAEGASAPQSGRHRGGEWNHESAHTRVLLPQALLCSIDRVSLCRRAGGHAV